MPGPSELPKRIIVVGLVGIAILFAIALLAIWFIGERATPARSGSPAPAAHEPSFT